MDSSSRGLAQQASGIGMTPAAWSTPRRLHIGGSPMPEPERSTMSARFGTDLSRVRIHADGAAARLTRAVGARAFTVGSHVYFAQGQFAPGHSRGLRLLAHELAHVTQQEGLGDRLQRQPLDLPARGSGFEDPRGPGASTTLPYREATELAECIRILGEDSHALCRAEVLGEHLPPPPLPQARTSTPVQEEATILPDGSQRLRIGEVQVLIRPDLHDVAGMEGGETEYDVSLDPENIEVPYEMDSQGRITSFTPPDPGVSVSIQTQYGEGVDPSTESAYGRGTRDEDLEAGTTSLRFHEGEHGQLYLDYLRAHPFPQFEGRVGMSEARFRTTVQEYLDAISSWGDELGNYSLQQGDCVGVTIDEHRGDEPDWEPVCEGVAP